MMPDKVDSKINLTIDNSDSCNNCCCWPRKEPVRRKPVRQRGQHHLAKDAKAVEKTDQKVHKTSDILKETNAEGITRHIDPGL